MPHQPPPDALFEKLDARDVAILRGLASYQTEVIIAETAGIALRTVKNRIARLKNLTGSQTSLDHPFGAAR